MSYAEQKKLYGVGGNIAVGGAVDEEPDNSASMQKSRNNATIDFVGFHAESVVFFD
ncbi:MAG: hypothetical protein ACKPKO_28010 [Candidatus Fonsibacter sp.]